VFVLWLQGGGPYLSAWSTWFEPGADSWSAPAHLDLESFGDVEDASLAVLPGGGALALWTQKDIIMKHNVWAALFDPDAASWMPAAMIESVPGDLRGARLLIDAQGTATATWLSEQGDLVWANRRSGQPPAWGSASVVTHAQGAVAPLMAANASGDLIGLFLQGSTPRDVYALRYGRAGASWREALRFDTMQPRDASAPQLAVDATGHAGAIWLQNDGMRDDLWASVLDARWATWGPPLRLESMSVASAEHPRLAIDAAGNLLAVWSQREQTWSSIWVNRYQIETASWSGAQRIDVEDMGDATAPELILDAFGHATVVWLQSDGARQNVWANRLE
jgi:hypothetical protein